MTMRDELSTLTHAWFDAWRTKDSSFLERTMAADYVYVAPNGVVMDRLAILAIARDSSYGITEGAHTEVEIASLGNDAALVRHHWRGHGMLRGKKFVDNHRCVMIWQRTANGWQVRYEQASPGGT